MEEQKIIEALKVLKEECNRHKDCEENCKIVKILGECVSDLMTIGTPDMWILKE